MVTLADLVEDLGSDLKPRAAPSTLQTRVTGVHVSELTDPTPYLSGGELLLSTGMNLTDDRGRVHSYVARLRDAHVAALGLGLGPVHTAVPAVLQHACAALGLTLFSVPAPTPFLAVSRAFWRRVSLEEHEELSTSLGAYRDLVRAATRPDPVTQVVRSLGAAVHGWAARLGPEGALLDVWPRNRRATAREAARELERVHAMGPHTSATFPLSVEDVVVQPLTRGARLVGHVVIGCPRPVAAGDRRLQLAACSLLALQLHRDHETVVRRRTQHACIAQLVVTGAADAARQLADAIGDTRLPLQIRLIRVRFGDALRARELLDRWEHNHLRDVSVWLADDGEHAWVLVASTATDRVLSDLTSIGGGLTAVTSPSLPPASVAAHAERLSATLSRARAGDVIVPPDDLHLSQASACLDRLSAHRGGTLVETVATYLRCRGHWEETARVLGVHRNTVRHRITTASREMGLELDDPDAASALWLELRARGMA